jgi:hypothetical protein
MFHKEPICRKLVCTSSVTLEETSQLSQDFHNGVINVVYTEHDIIKWNTLYSIDNGSFVQITQKGNDMGGGGLIAYTLRTCETSWQLRCSESLLPELKYKYVHRLQWIHFYPIPRFIFVSTGNWVAGLREDMKWKLFESMSDSLKWQDGLEEEEKFVCHISSPVTKFVSFASFHAVTQRLLGKAINLLKPYSVQR